MRATHIVVGAGSAGCTLAARLSERPHNRVVLIEAGSDHPPDAAPDDIRDTYAGRALTNPSYFWPNLRVRRSDGEHLSERGRAPFFFEQARVIGGGSSVNGQVALRGAPADYEGWHERGAVGWGWASVLPYFRRLERDLDYTDQLHGAEGPITVRRIPRERWDDFTLAVAAAWEKRGHRYVEDLNGTFAEGYGPIPLSNDGSARISSAIGYLNAEVRRRPNLEILAETVARRVVFRGRRACGVEVARGGEIRVIEGETIVLSAGALRSPWLLMLSGVGPGRHLAERGIAVVADRPGVGANLQDHPLISVSAYLPPRARSKPVIRRNYAYLRYSSGEPGCDPADMVAMAVCRSAWHAVGERIGTLSTFIALPFSRGRVRLASPDPSDEPEVCFGWLDDARDRSRLVAAFRDMAGVLATDPVTSVASDAFPSTFSERIRRMSRPTPLTVAYTAAAGLVLDWSGGLRRHLVEHVISEAPPLAALLADPAALERYVCDTVTSAWHASGTCRMGRPDDPMSVADPAGRVIGTENLYVADASVMPRVTRTNTNIPTIMIAERVADLMRP